PERFRAPFTAAEGWGTFAQEREAKGMKATVELKLGRLRLRSLGLEVPGGMTVAGAKARARKEVAVRGSQDGRRGTLAVGEGVTLEAGQGLRVEVTYREGRGA